MFLYTDTRYQSAVYLVKCNSKDHLAFTINHTFSSYTNPDLYQHLNSQMRTTERCPKFIVNTTDLSHLIIMTASQHTILRKDFNKQLILAIKFIFTYCAQLL